MKKNIKKIKLKVFTEIARRKFPGFNELVEGLKNNNEIAWKCVFLKINDLRYSFNRKELTIDEKERLKFLFAEWAVEKPNLLVYGDTLRGLDRALWEEFMWFLRYFPFLKYKG